VKIIATEADSMETWEEVVASIKNIELRSEFILEEVPAPARLAPHSFALSLDVVNSDDEDLASGRFVVLHDPAGQETWDGTVRIVTFVRAPIEADVASDEIFDEVAWSWIMDALTQESTGFHNISGTVTRTVSKSFAGIEDRERESDVEIRASWTPNSNDIGNQLSAWLVFVEQCSGLLPMPSGVSAINRNR
jgi:hypothetical protein